MKKALLLFLLALVGSTFSLFAQTATTPGAGFKPDEGTWGFTGGITGLQNITLTGSGTGTLGFRYALANGLTARLSLNLSTSHSKTDSTGLIGQGNSGVENIVTTNSPSIMAISLGISKSWEGTDRLDPYIGADLRISNAGGGKTIDRTQINNADSALSYPGSKTGDYDQITSKNASGISIAIIPCVGFYYYIAKHVAIGAEFGWGFGFTHTSGGSVVEESVVGGASSVTTTTNLETKVSNNGFGTTGNATLDFIVWY